MYDSPHPGEFIQEVYLQESGVSSRTVAAKLKIAPSTFTRLLNGNSRLTPEMALRLSKSWLKMQNNYDLWQARKRLNLDEVEELGLSRW